MRTMMICTTTLPPRQLLIFSGETREIIFFNSLYDSLFLVFVSVTLAGHILITELLAKDIDIFWLHYSSCFIIWRFIYSLLKLYNCIITDPENILVAYLTFSI